MIGDAGIDMEIALATGLFPILVKDGKADDAEFEKHPPRLQVANFGELVRLISEL